ncbi:MAG TPA: GDP-mannose dehydrogenase, partial [Verrucomicrobiae bacterium]|nr:GDP-mannose dehydrogenase [Verrucomicrobiae bacterium]
MIGFAGLSHLGIVYSLATASRGLEVLGFDPDAALCRELGEGRFPVSEPGLEGLFHSHHRQIQFSADPASLRRCDLVFYSLDVPTDDSNRSNLEPLRELIERTVLHVAPTATAVILSQVPPGFTRSLKISLAGRGGRELFYQVETLVFGNAVQRALQ